MVALWVVWMFSVLTLSTAESPCEVCEDAVSTANKLSQDGSPNVDVHDICAMSPHAEKCEGFWRTYGLQVLTLLDQHSDSSHVCSHEYIACDTKQKTSTSATITSFIELDAAAKAQDEAAMRVQDAMEMKVQAAMKEHGVIQDVTSYEAAKAEKIEGRMKDILERFRRNASRLQAFRESLLSLYETDSVTVDVAPHDRLAMDTTAFVQEGMQTGDVDERLDHILAMVEECKKIAHMNEMRLKDVRGSLTSLVEVDSWTQDIAAEDRALLLELSSTLGRAGPSSAPPVGAPAHDDSDDSDSDAVGRGSLDSEERDTGTIPLPDSSEGNPDFFAGDFPTQRSVTLEEARAEAAGLKDEVQAATEGHHHHHHHRHRHDSPAEDGEETKALNDKLDRVLGTMQHIMLTNQDTSLRLKKIDRVGELVDQLEKMTADYSDAIGIMRGQFMSLLEVSSTVTAEAQTEDHHHHHSSSASPSLRQSLTKSSGGDALTHGIDLLDADTGLGGPRVSDEERVGGQALLQGDEGGDDGRLKRRLFPGGRRATENSPLPAVSAPDLGDNVASSPVLPSAPTTGSAEAGVPPEVERRRRHHHHAPEAATEGSAPPDQDFPGPGSDAPPPDGSVAYADNLLMQAHEKRMDEVIGSLEDLVKMMENNFERIRELKRELDIFLEEDVFTAPLTSAERAAFLEVPDPDQTLSREELFGGLGDLQLDKRSWLRQAEEDREKDDEKQDELLNAMANVGTGQHVTHSHWDGDAAEAQILSRAELLAGIGEEVPDRHGWPISGADEWKDDTPGSKKASLQPDVVALLQQDTPQQLPETTAAPLLPVIASGSDPMQEMLVDAGLGLDFASDLFFIITEIEAIRGTKSNAVIDDGWVKESSSVDKNKVALMEAMGKTIRKDTAPVSPTSVERAADAQHSLAPMSGNENAAEAASILDRFTRTAKHNTFFFRNYLPP